ncbi:MAG: hypothetical protein AAF928_19740 [Myxococcota bacterium]
MPSPLSIVKSRFESKQKLVEAVEKLMTEDLWLDRLSSDRGGDKGLRHVSNFKLLRLHDTFSAVKEQFGSRVGLIDAILELENRSKDEGYKRRLQKYPVPRLYDRYRSAKKRSVRAEKAQAARAATG